MTKSTWDSSLETGNKTIDAQHRKLVGLVDKLEDANLKSNDDVLLLLDRMEEFALVHFSMEEKLMEQVKYPIEATEIMVQQHREFKSYIRLRILEFRQGLFNIIPFQSFVGHFLKVHEFGLDKGLANWIRQQKAA